MSLGIKTGDEDVKEEDEEWRSGERTEDARKRV